MTTQFNLGAACPPPIPTPEMLRDLRDVCAPAVLPVLGQIALPSAIGLRLRSWFHDLMQDPTVAVNLPALLTAYGDLSVLFLSACSWRALPHSARGEGLLGSVEMIDRGGAVPVRATQVEVARLAHRLHAEEGARMILVAIERERAQRRRIAALVAERSW
jgi:hypothetical protein